MNTPLRKVAVACFVLFGLLLLNANYVQVVKAGDYKRDPRNTRVLLREYDRQRGSILIGTGRTVLAQSSPTTDALKYLRTYPGGAIYAPVTGYDSLVYNTTGIERLQDPVLSGDDDRLFVRRLSDYITGRKLSGGSVTLTLDAAAQRAAYAALAGKRGAVVALDPRTGAVLAEVSTPSYDPTVLSSHDSKQIMASYKALTAAQAAPLLNRAVAQTYPPGSTFKVITTAAALATGRYSPTSIIPSPTVLQLPQTTVGLRNFGGESCGGQTTTLQHALTISCNTAFASLGLTLGADAVRQQAAAFGFGDNDLRLPQGVADSVYPADPTPPQVAQSAIGQYDVRVTPLQMAMVAAGIANGGTVMTPYLVQSVQAPDLTVLDQASPKVYRSGAVTPDVAKTLTSMMVDVVQNGTGTAAQIPGVTVAGKTGTAQHGTGEAPHAWFISFAPAEAPKVAVAVLVEDGGNAGSEATGGAVAAPIAKAVMQAVLGQ